MRIRRPLYYIATVFAAAILIRFYFGNTIAIGAGGMLVAVIAGSGQKHGDSQYRKLLLILLLTYSVSLFHMYFFDQRLSADPVLDHFDETVEMIGIVEEPSYYTNAKGKTMLRIQTDVRKIKALGTESGQGTEEHNNDRTSNKATKIQKTKKCRILVSAQAEGEMGQENETEDEGPQMDLTKVPPGSVIRFFGTLKQPEGRRNPNCFDYCLYLKTCGIQATLRTEHLEMLRDGYPGVRSLKTRLFLMRENYLRRLAEHAGENTAALIRAILFGEKGQLSDDVQELFQKNGTAHILAVSGLHVGMLYGALAALWNLLSAVWPGIFGTRRGKRFFACCVLFFTGYMFLAGYTPSVVRAVCMVLLHAFASMTGRRYDLGSAAFAVGIAALYYNPYIIFQAGFQMSFLAILTLSLICPYIRQVYDGVLVGSIAVQIGLGPYIAYQFNTLSLVAILINVPAIALAGILVPAGLLGMLLPGAAAANPSGSGASDFLIAAAASFPGGGLTELYDQGLASLCAILVRMNELCCIDHITSMTVASPPIGVVAAFYLGLLVFASEEGRLFIHRGRRSMICVAVAAILLGASLFGHAADDGFRHLDMVFVDVGQGDCIHLRSGGRSFLIDGGGSTDYPVGEKTLRPYLLKNGVSYVDGAFVTHLHTDHYQGICELAKAGMIRRLYIYEGNRVKLKQICEETGLQEKQIRFLRQGQTVRLPGGQGGWLRRGVFPLAAGKEASKEAGGRGDSIEILWPPAKSEAEYLSMIANEEDENAASLIMRVTVDDVSMLATGDLGEEGEQQLLTLYGTSNGSWERPGNGTGKEENDNASLDADILKVGHHGSKLQTDILKVGHHGSKTSSSEEFLDTVRPAFAVIQVGKNNMYGHPTPEALRRLEAVNALIFRTDLQGAIGLKLKNGRILRFRTIIEQNEKNER